MSTPAAKLELRVISDTICPFCYIGYKKADRALEMAKQEGLEFELNLKYEPFRLDPSLPDDHGVDKRERLIKKFGSRERYEQLQQRMSAIAQPLGINISPGGKVRQTTASQRLLAEAYDKGGQTSQRALQEVLFRGYFEQEQDIGDFEFLSDAAAESGVFTKAEALDFLESDRGLAEYHASVEAAYRLGVQGVPFTIVNNKYAIEGAQEPEAFLEVFKKALADQQAGRT